MSIKIAIIDPLGAHGSSHHLYLFGQAKGLINSGLNVTLSDLVVLPYKKIYQSGVMMMALSYEKPVLASDLPPLKEIIGDNKTGFFFESKNPHSLTKKLNQILEEYELLEQVRKNGTYLANKKYDWNKLGLLTKTAYESIY